MPGPGLPTRSFLFCVFCASSWLFVRPRIGEPRMSLAQGFIQAIIEAAAPELARLRSLDLGYNLLGPEQVKPLAASPHLVRLGSLNLACNPLGNGGAAALAAAPLARLSELYLYRTQLGAAGLEALLRA